MTRLSIKNIPHTLKSLRFKDVEESPTLWRKKKKTNNLKIIRIIILENSLIVPLLKVLYALWLKDLENPEKSLYPKAENQLWNQYFGPLGQHCTKNRFCNGNHCFGSQTLFKTSEHSLSVYHKRKDKPASSGLKQRTAGLVSGSSKARIRDGNGVH